MSGASVCIATTEALKPVRTDSPADLDNPVDSRNRRGFSCVVSRGVA